MKNNTVKKVTKKFSNFSQEEQWLQSMLIEGWVLKSYDSEDVDDCQYVFERVKSENQKRLIYKIDFRDFNKKGEFEEYKEIFEDSGWTSLSKNKWYSKHIFYTTSTNAKKDIFSDQNSYRDRERRRMSYSLISGIISFFIFVVTFILFIIFEKTSIIVCGLFIFSFSIKYMIDYFRHRKVYRSLLESE